ncbi:hypothetical protein ADK66_22360 [Micromonospora sp. NRRL B-16802]|nr:hypothetical protein ADK66_22360 [Micromonospora sp. NRRL B-16802]
MLVCPHEILDHHAVEHVQAGAPLHQTHGDLPEPLVRDRCGAALAALRFGPTLGRRRKSNRD